MLRYSGADELADAVAADPGAVPAALTEVRALMEQAARPVA
jgi:hypothetical protein